MPAKLNSSSVGLESVSPAAETPDFVREAQRAARWRSPWVRAGLGLVALALLAVLAAQLALHERARLAAMEPRAKPWLDKLCQIELYTRGQACNVGALQQIESIVVDASTFNKLRFDSSSETYRLAASLKNTSALPLAMPAVEVSFTDSQEKVLLRRVLSATDFGAGAQQAQSIPAGGEFAGVSTLVVDVPALAGGKITGYRLLAFYP